MKKPINKLLGDFLASRGFYIVLVLCVCAVGVSGWYLSRELTAPPVQPVAGTAQVAAPSPSPVVQPPIVTSKPTPAPTPTPVTTPTPSPSPSAEAWGGQIYTWPVKGQVIGDFSLEVLAYDETMADWRTHSGMDIAAQVGAKVKAVTAGTVTGVYEDALMGSVVTMEHGDGLTSLYANLAPEPPVKVGDVLDTAAVLGAVGESAIAEVSKSAHLHFEMAKDGVEVDPVNYLPQQ